MIQVTGFSSGYWNYELYYSNYGKALHEAGEHEKEKGIYEIGQSFFPKSVEILRRQIVCSLSMGVASKANEHILKFRSINKELSNSESTIESNLGQICREANIINQAELHFRKAYELNPQSVGQILWLADLLIENDINVDEGMELVSKGFEIKPDNLYLLWIKGLACYKQGKYEEAVQLLRRAEEGLGFNSDLCKQLHEAEQELAPPA